jgi:hypothetical protein
VASAHLPGHGRATVGGYVAPGRGGLSVTLDARINQILSAFAQGRIGIADGKTEYEAAVGIEADW